MMRKKQMGSMNNNKNKKSRKMRIKTRMIEIKNNMMMFKNNNKIQILTKRGNSKTV